MTSVLQFASLWNDHVNSTKHTLRVISTIPGQGLISNGECSGRSYRSDNNEYAETHPGNSGFKGKQNKILLLRDAQLSNESYEM